MQEKQKQWNEHIPVVDLNLNPTTPNVHAAVVMLVLQKSKSKVWATAKSHRGDPLAQCKQYRGGL